MGNYNRFSFILIILSCCGSKQSVTDIKDYPEEVPIVLFDLKDKGRVEIAQILNEIKRCSPLVIGLDIVFPTRKNDYSDSLLVKSLTGESPKVILTGFVEQNGQMTLSDSLFNRATNHYGVHTEFRDKEGRMKYVPLYSNNIAQSDNFSAIISFYFLQNADMFKNVISNRTSLIQEVVPKNRFKVISDEDFNCEDIKNKIILLGDIQKSESTYEAAVVVYNILKDGAIKYYD